MHGPFTEKIAALVPDLWASYLRAVEREKHEGELRRMLELYGRPVSLEIVEDVHEDHNVADSPADRAGRAAA